MFKTILIILFMVLMIADVFFIVFTKLFVKGTKSNDLDVKITAQEKVNRLSIIGYIIFAILFAIFIIIMKLF